MQHERVARDEVLRGRLVVNTPMAPLWSVNGPIKVGPLSRNSCPARLMAGREMARRAIGHVVGRFVEQDIFHRSTGLTTAAPADQCLLAHERRDAVLMPMPR